MTRDEVLAKLKSAEGALRALGVGELYLYGSVARDEADGESDVDLFMDPVPDRPLGFREYMRAREMLRDHCSAPSVDFSTRDVAAPDIVDEARGARRRTGVRRCASRSGRRAPSSPPVSG